MFATLFIVGMVLINVALSFVLLPAHPSAFVAIVWILWCMISGGIAGYTRASLDINRWY